MYRNDGTVPVLVPPLSFVPDGALCVILQAFALCETFRVNIIEALNKTHGKRWPASVLAELATLNEFQKDTDASSVSLIDSLLDVHNTLSETFFSLSSNMPDLNPLTLETNIMNSYGNCKLFEQNSTGAWCVNSDTVKLLTIVETAVKKRGAQLPIRTFLNQNIAKNNRSSGLLSVADDVPEDFYSIIRPVVDKLRLHVTSNYVNVGSNYETDLLPMYTELTKACEALLAKANSLNRATTPTSTLTNTGTTSVLALHALTTAGGRRGGTNGSPSTGGNAAQQQDGGPDTKYITLDIGMSAPVHYDHDMVAAFTLLDQKRLDLASMMKDNSINKPTDVYPIRFRQKTSPCWEFLTEGKCRHQIKSDAPHGSKGVSAITAMNKLLKDAHFYKTSATITRMVGFADTFNKNTQKRIDDSKGGSYSQAAQRGAQRQQGHTTLPPTPPAFFPGDMTPSSTQGRDNILFPLPAFSPSANSVDPDTSGCPHKHCIWGHKSGQTDCYCQMPNNLKRVTDFNDKHPKSKIHVCGGPTDDPKKCHHNLRIIESARHSLAWGVRCNLIPSNTFGAAQAAQTPSNLSFSSDAVQMLNDLAQDQMQYAREIAQAEAAYGNAPAGTAFAPPNLPPRRG